MRLDKYISNSLGISRSEVKKLIKNGRITAGGETAKSADMKIDENTAEISVDGNKIKYRKFIYLMMNKPQGYISATEDRHYKTVVELISEEYAHYGVFPAGRLDIDTEGLLILTNDGDFAHRIMSPSKNVYKTYYAELDKPAVTEDIEAFKKGMEFKDFTAKSAALKITDDPRKVYISIAEGKYHQVKRMFERAGKTVEFLKRVKIGALALDENLRTGESREMTPEERDLIFRQ